MDSHRRHRSNDTHRRELRHLRNRHRVELRQRDMQVERYALEKAQLVEKIDELNRLLEDRVAIRNHFYSRENASSSTEQGESLPLNIRVGKVADKLMEFAKSPSVIPEIPGGSRSSKGKFDETTGNWSDEGNSYS